MWRRRRGKGSLVQDPALAVGDNFDDQLRVGGMASCTMLHARVCRSIRALLPTCIDSSYARHTSQNHRMLPCRMACNRLDFWNTLVVIDNTSGCGANPSRLLPPTTT